MAHGVTSPAIVVHQALHGYADGHRLLASSIPLKPRDAKIVATLSDASGSTVNLEDAGYLTGYPLHEAGLYAFAKTWPAPEMPRPGCVWTHTLLVDFADLAAIQNLAELAPLFFRPQEREGLGKRYSVDLALDPSTQVARADGSPEVLRQLLWALYHRPQERVFSTEGEPNSREGTILALWSQQWPRLRRSFRFCTLVWSDRSSDATPFDLQFGSMGDRSLRSRLAKLFDADRASGAERASWLETGLRDLLEPGSLRLFLRALGAELEGGRELFQPLCELYEVLNAPDADGKAIADGAALLEGPLRAAEARDVRAELLRRIADTAEDVDQPVLSFSVKNLHLVADASLAQLARRIGAALWRQDPTSIVRMLGASEREQALAKHTIAGMPTRTILTGLIEHPVLAPTLLHERQDLLSEPDLWAAETLQPAVLEAVRAIGDPRSSVIEAAVEAAAPALIPLLCELWSRESVLNTLIDRLQRRDADLPTSQESRWFSVAMVPYELGTVLLRRDTWGLTTLCALAHLIQPDDPPNDYGEDPVFTALRRAHGDLLPISSLFLRSWVLARALGYRSSNQAELLSFGFDEVYLAVLASELPIDAWRLLDRRLPNSIFWGDWDRGRRLRAGILSAFVERHLDAGTFGRLLLDSEELFGVLVSEAVRMWGGRSYIRQVKRALRDADPHRYAARISVLKRVL
jgi:hypothetical protein